MCSIESFQTLLNGWEIILHHLATRIGGNDFGVIITALFEYWILYWKGFRDRRLKDLDTRLIGVLGKVDQEGQQGERHHQEDQENILK